jgi:hypothetical protein
MKRILFTLLMLSTVTLVRAQKTNTVSTTYNQGLSSASGLKLGIGINPGLSVGTSGSDFVLGGEISLYKNLTSKLEGTFSAGYTQFFYGHDTQKGKLIPVKAGIRYSLTNKLYIGAQAGVAFSTTDGGAYFLYSPTVGWKLSNQFDVGLKYDHFSNEPAVLGLNLTYKFGL